MCQCEKLRCDLANLSHEIRTQMNAIIGLTDLMFKTGLTDRQRDYLSKIQSSTHFLLMIINEILDLSKIDAGKLDLEPVNFHLSDVIFILSDMLSSMAAEKGVKLIITVAGDAPGALVGDPLVLCQILINFTHNAIKSTGNGKVVVKVGLLEKN